MTVTYNRLDDPPPASFDDEPEPDPSIVVDARQTVADLKARATFAPCIAPATCLQRCAQRMSPAVPLTAVKRM